MAQDADNAADEAALEAAAAWRIRLAEARRPTTPAFARWRLANPRHERAWRRVSAPWDLIAEHAESPVVQAARDDAWRRLRRAERVGRRLRLLLVLAATFAVISVALTLAAAAWLRPTVYQTGPRARRVFDLADGSRVTLDGGTVLKVRMRARGRDLALVKGQARFDVAHDASRPFRVHADGRLVTALGTRFTVDLLGPAMRVTLLEGRVVVSRDPAVPAPPAGAQTRSVTLRPGERLILGGGAPAEPARIETVSGAQAIAWEQGQLVFEDEPLAAVAARISRYAAQPVVVVDRPAAALRMSGVFAAGDTATFLDTVTRYLPVKAEPGRGGRVELRSRDVVVP